MADSEPTVREIVKALDALLGSEGCSAYVKTIYVGYELCGEMVAAVYPHPGWVEIALALPEDTAGTDIVDATHLTWRTMPVALTIRDERQLPRAEELVRQAIERVSTGTHEINRPPEFFMGRKQWGVAGKDASAEGTRE